MTNEQIRISGKNLGELAMPNFCPRCFWIKLRLQNRLPFQVFPGIFSSIDAYTKHVIHGWIDDLGAAPEWLSELGDISGYIDPPHFSKFYLVDETYNIKLTGAADGIFKMADGSRMIVDYKTARYTNGQDELLPIYETQLNAYAMIAEEIGISPVSGLALIYMEPATSREDAEEDESRLLTGFAMRFHSTIKNISLDTGSIATLLERTRTIFDSPNIPNGQTHCKNCVTMSNLLALPYN